MYICVLVCVGSLGSDISGTLLLGFLRQSLSLGHGAHPFDQAVWPARPRDLLSLCPPYWAYRGTAPSLPGLFTWDLGLTLRWQALYRPRHLPVFTTSLWHL